MINKNQLKETALGGLIQNPTFVMVLGMCPTIGVSTNVIDSLSMGIATAFVLICSNVLISLLRKVIPSQVRLPSYIIIMATFATLVQLFMDKLLPGLYDSVAGFIALIAVNCIILARAEAFASSNGVLLSLLDGFSMGTGFLLSLTLLGAVRQFLNEILKMAIFAKPAGGFIVLGLLMGFFNFVSWLLHKKFAEKDVERKKLERNTGAAQKEGV